MKTFFADKGGLNYSYKLFAINRAHITPYLKVDFDLKMMKVDPPPPPNTHVYIHIKYNTYVCFGKFKF